jgi:hypothetical protein
MLGKGSDSRLRRDSRSRRDAAVNKVVGVAVVTAIAMMMRMMMGATDVTSAAAPGPSAFSGADRALRRREVETRGGSTVMIGVVTTVIEGMTVMAAVIGVASRLQLLMPGASTCRVCKGWPAARSFQPWHGAAARLRQNLGVARLAPAPRRGALLAQEAAHHLLHQALQLALLRRR